MMPIWFRVKRPRINRAGAQTTLETAFAGASVLKAARGVGGFGLAMCLFIMVGIGLASAQQTTIFFNIGTGSVAGSYFRIGDLLAGIISHPSGSVRCTESQACGPAGLIAVARASEGSVYNVQAVNAGIMESALAQANVVEWAIKGTGPFKKAEPLTRVRAIANLYPEAVHFVVRTEAGIKRVRDLRGKRVSVDRKGSGSFTDAMLILKAMRVRPRDVKLEYLDPDLAAERIENGTLDAFFYTVGAPVPAIADLIADKKANLVPLKGKAIDALRLDHKHLLKVTIDADSYGLSAPVATLGVGALWIVNETVDEALVYNITHALWDERNKPLLEEGHALGKQIIMANARDGFSVPLHPGAERYYSETVGIVPDGQVTDIQDGSTSDKPL
jgi:TRAP transporter TAXI family solute receptor